MARVRPDTALVMGITLRLIRAIPPGLRPSAVRRGDRADLLHEAHHINHGLRLGDLPAKDPVNV
jgi:hypothetical protein